MRRFAKIVLVTWIGFLGHSASADSISISGVGGVNFSSPTYTTSGTAQDVATKLGIGFGAQLEFPILPFFHIEVDALYVNHKFTRAGFDFAYNHVQIPVLLRFTAIPIISIGVGPYYSQAVGNFSQTPTIGGITVETDYDIGLVKRSDFGVVASVALTYSLAPLVSLVFDARYQFGLFNQFNNPLNPNDDFKFRGIQAWGGIRFGI